MSETGDPTGMPIADRMKAMLEQAAQEQLNEQQRLAEALIDLRARMDQISAELAALRLDAGSGERVDGAVGAVTAEIREAVRLLGERLDGLSRMVHQRGLDLTELRGLVAELKTTVTAHGEALSGITGGLDALPSYGERVAALHQQIAALGERIAGLDDVRAAVADVDRRVGSTADGLAEVSRTVTALAPRLAALPDAAALEATTSAVAEVSRRIDGLATSLVPLAESVKSMQEGLRAETERGARLAETLAELGDRLEDLADRSGGSDLEDLTRRLDELQADLTSIGGNLAGLAESAPDPDEVAAALDATRSVAAAATRIDELAAQVDRLHDALLGADGLDARVADLADRVEGLRLGGGADPREVAAVVAEAVAREVAASEQRLTGHLDEAMLALAEALLRRRGTRVGASISRTLLTDIWGQAEPQPATEAAAVAVEPEDAGDETGAAVVEAEGSADEVEAAADEAEGSADEAAVADDGSAGEAEAAAGEPEDTAPEAAQPWWGGAEAAPEWYGEPGGEPAQTPDRIDLTAAAEPPAEPAVPKRKRRPWWRPGG